MSRRFLGHMSGERFCGDAAREEIHDLDFEQPECRIDTLIHEGDDIPYESVEHAHGDGFDNCVWCIGKRHH